MRANFVINQRYLSRSWSLYCHFLCLINISARTHDLCSLLPESWERGRREGGWSSNKRNKNYLKQSLFSCNSWIHEQNIAVINHYWFNSQTLLLLHFLTQRCLLIFLFLLLVNKKHITDNSSWLFFYIMCFFFAPSKTDSK